MADRFITPKIKVFSTGIFGRHICSIRDHHFLVDDGKAHDGPGQEPGAAELFLSGISTCATMMIERLARHSNLPLKAVEVAMDATIDTEAKHQGPPVMQRAHMEFRITGLSRAQADELVEAYKHY